jgi:hypothetical protein
LDDGTSTPQLSHEDYLRAHHEMNETYGNYNICFNLYGYETYENSTYEQWPSTNFNPLVNHMKSIGKYKDDAINVYLYRSSAAAGVSSTKNAIGVSKWQFKNDPQSQVLIHEMGHQLGLSHTHLGWIIENCEHVTRNPNDTNYNATTRGDNILDTNAVPDFRNEQRDHGRKALRDQGFTVAEAANIINNDAGQGNNGFAGHPQEALIESILLDYGFTSNEINQIKWYGATPFAYVNSNTCSYIPDSRIQDPNSPFFKDCEKTIYQISSSDLHNHMSYMDVSCRNQFTTGQGIFMHEYIENDNSDYFLDRFVQHPLDLYTRDHEGDIGQEPNIHTDIFWQSSDIWVRNQNDGLLNQTHQNPEYDPSSPNYVYVRVINKSCIASTGTEELFLHWAKAGIGGGWPALWNGEINDPVLMGDLIYEQTIPIIQSGGEAILEFEWYPPDPDDYVDYSPNNDPWHFCLLSRIVTPNDPMAFPEISGNMVKRNNNNASKNVTVVSNPKPGSLAPGGAIFIGNIVGLTSATFNFEFKTLEEISSQIYNEAEIVLTLNEDTWNKWLDGGRQSQNIEIYPKGVQQLIITDNNAWLNNLVFGSGEWDVMYVSFNFLTKEVTNKSFFEYFAIQHDAVTGEIIGGETYHITRDITRPHFEASAIVTEDIGEINFSANSIDEAAKYNWYAPDGTLVHTGIDFTFTGSFAGEYTLEVIAENDAHKDYYYYLVESKQNDDQIISLSPNPASLNVLVNYQVNIATTANLQLVKLCDTFSTNFTLDINENEININLANYPIGIYAVVLITDGQPVHAKQLIIN